MGAGMGRPLCALILTLLICGCVSVKPRQSSTEVEVGSAQLKPKPGRPEFGFFKSGSKLRPRGCESSGTCTLAADLAFVDRQQRLEWSAKAGNKTDGASIPKIFQPFIGSPFDSTYLDAAIIHDHYCDRNVRSFLSTHRVFYNAMMALGVEKKQALIMYYAVLVGGPKWLKLEAGEVCGPTCIRDARLAQFGVMASADGKFVTRGPRYDDAAVKSEMRKGEDWIKNAATPPSLDEIERRAIDRYPGDPMLQNLGQYEVTRSQLVPRT